MRGSIIRSRARWYEQGERNTKYFLNLETHNKKKSCVWRLLNSVGAEITDANNILEEVYNFYSDLYDEKAEFQTCLLYTSPSPRDLSTSRMPSSA